MYPTTLFSEREYANHDENIVKKYESLGMKEARRFVYVPCYLDLPVNTEYPKK